MSFARPQIRMNLVFFADFPEEEEAEHRRPTAEQFDHSVARIGLYVHVNEVNWYIPKSGHSANNALWPNLSVFGLRFQK